MIPAVHIIPILQDNYSFIIDSRNGGGVIIDPGQPDPLIYALKDCGVNPYAILCTHHHPDHVAGAQVLKEKFGIPVIGSFEDRTLIPTLDQTVREGDVLSYPDLKLTVMETPGHTRGHIAFFEGSTPALFCGDTVFSMGCGRIMDQGGADLWHSLQKIKKLPPETQIYCGHEYTHANGAFAQTVLGKTPALGQRLAEVVKYRENNLPTIPVRLSVELETNPFLRAQSYDEFITLRRQKDRF